MNRRLTFPTKLILAAALVLSLALAGCGGMAHKEKAQAEPAAQVNPAPAPSPAVEQQTAAPEAGTMPSKEARWVERHITYLHKQLEITPDQETEWNALAQTMRDNAAAMKASYGQWKTLPGAPNALDILKLHAQMAGAQAQAWHNLITAFTPLYNKMPDAQKKLADDVFAHRHHMVKKHHVRKHKATVKKAAPDTKQTQENQAQ